ncbi:tRNA (guanine-N1)-methyltransferase [butyrate-producing bacterium SS3/4]|nr:tRNA (guanine-N1)-methyltransferase [butyrate-producing bacterium SS3/4]
MNFHVLTLFPEMIMNGLETSILGRAAAKGIVSFEAVNIRDYTLERHGKVDDYPYGGGAGMVMQAEPIYRAYEALVEKIGKKPRVIYMTPQGQTFNQGIAEDLAKEEDLVFLCGHYEGVDERVLEMIATDYLSAGDYVLTGGELPAMMMIDCISRLVPGVLNNNVSAEFETFHDNLLEYPQYTRPEVFMGKKVPDILLSGHHANVEKWRREQSIIRTLKNRPELLENAVLSKKEQKFLDELLRQQELENAQKVKNKEKAAAEHDGEETV